MGRSVPSDAGRAGGSNRVIDPWPRCRWTRADVGGICAGAAHFFAAGNLRESPGHSVAASCQDGQIAWGLIPNFAGFPSRSGAGGNRMLYGPIPSPLVRGCLPSSAALFGSHSITPFHSDSGRLVSPSCHERPRLHRRMRPPSGSPHRRVSYGRGVRQAEDGGVQWGYSTDFGERPAVRSRRRT